MENINIDVNLFSIAKMKKCSSLFEQIDFPYALIKGDSLSIQAYGTPGKREYGDIDILIDKKDYIKLKKVLRKEGFVESTQDRSKQIAVLLNTHQATPWVKRIDPFGILEIDINMNLFWGEKEQNTIDLNAFLENTVPVEIYGTNINILSPIMSVVQLALHHYKDLNSIYLLATRRRISINSFKDMYFLIKNNSEFISPEVLYDISKSFDILPYMYYVLYYTNEVMNDVFLKPYIGLLETDEGVFLLDKYGLNDAERKQWKVDFETRLNSDDLLPIIKNDLTAQDLKKINYNLEIMSS